MTFFSPSAINAAASAAALEVVGKSAWEQWDLLSLLASDGCLQTRQDPDSSRTKDFTPL